MKPIASLYTLKAMGCLFVVLQHIPFAGRGLVSPIINTAVPLFVMISGYFLYQEGKNHEEQCEYVKRQLLHFLRIIVKVNVVYLLYHLLRLLLNETYRFPLQSCEDVLEWLLYGDTLNYSFWYLNAYAQGLLLWWIMIKNALEKWIIYLPFLLVLGIFWGRYLFLFSIENDTLAHSLMHYSKNCFTRILPFLAIGYLAHKHQEKWQKIPIRYL